MPSYRRLTLEMRVAGLELAVAGPRKKDGVHLVAVDLVCPRPNVARKSVVRQIELTDGAAKMADLPWPKQLLFKESVEGPFGVEVRVSAALSNRELASLSGALGKAVAKGAAKSLAEGHGDVAGALLGVPAVWLASQIVAASDADPRWVASGWGRYEVGELGADASVPVELRAPADIVRTSRTRRAGRPATRRTRVLREGEPNGHIEFGVSVYE